MSILLLFGSNNIDYVSGLVPPNTLHLIRYDNYLP